MSLDRLLIAVLIGPELRRWKAQGRAPVFWWRDDDARRLTPALERLLSLARRFEAPLTLAVVPDGDIDAVVQACREAPDVELAIHGFRHQNRAAPGLPSGEVNAEDRLFDVVLDLGKALDAFRRAGVRPDLFVPPWNNAHPTLTRVLTLRGLALSCYGQARDDGPPRRLDAHLDVMRWKPRPRFRGGARFLLRLGKLLAQRRKTGAWDEPLGLLTHHLDHDEPAWRFLGVLLPVLKPVARTTLDQALEPRKSA
jgi:hypothetical protein